MKRKCIRCEVDFEPEPKTEARLQVRGGSVKVCPSCVLSSIYEMAAESVFEMTDEEIEAELRADGVDIEKFTSRTREILEEAMRRQRGPKTNEGIK